MDSLRIENFKLGLCEAVEQRMQTCLEMPVLFHTVQCETAAVRYNNHVA